MGSSAKQTISAQIPVELALAVEDLAKELARSKSWIIKGSVVLLAGRKRAEISKRSDWLCRHRCGTSGESFGYVGLR